MGLSKRLAERSIAELAPQFLTQFTTVRFGNVAGSNGSVIQIFRRQIERGGPVTVTHRRARRFFMSIPEAVRLVLQAAVYADTGGTFVLEMGEPVEIQQLARTMISLSGYVPDQDIAIEFTNLGQGEKLHEELHDQGEELMPTSHSRIWMIRATTEAGCAVLERVPAWRRMVQTGQSRELIAELDRIWPLFDAHRAHGVRPRPAPAICINGGAHGPSVKAAPAEIRQERTATQ
jgi:FlaA1/EpsC-like NDP-sugar epimerase